MLVVLTNSPNAVYLLARSKGVITINHISAFIGFVATLPQEHTTSLSTEDTPNYGVALLRSAQHY